MGDWEESTDNDIGAVPNRAKKPVVTQAKSKNKTHDNEGGTVINIALPDDISEKQELKIAAWVEDNEMLYNQTTKEFKNKAKKDRMFADFGATIGLSGIRIDKWYKSIRFSYGRIKERVSEERQCPSSLEVQGCLDQETHGIPEAQSEEQDPRCHHGQVSSAVSASAAPQSSHRDSSDIETMVYGKGKAPCSFTKVRASSNKVAKSTLDSARSEYLRKTAPETANMHKEMQDSLAALTHQRDHAAIWGESLAISARRLPFNLFQRFQMDSLALMNLYLGMAERGEDPDQIHSQSFMHQLQMAQPQRQYKQQYPQHDNSWPFYTNMAPGPPLLQSSIHTIPRDQAAQNQHNSTPSTVSNLRENPSSVTSSRDSSLNIRSLINTMVDSPYSQDSSMYRQGDIE
ncbi:unnamed protein product [Mytilus coruscus]|uniref:MADF domain-containing protein n=1 Tax=Mytilus coruscus TaxID=42192 RepID=A0A6J8EC61_MYTCO|nr:unnamed protein product [Mytilus coruscus]